VHDFSIEDKLKIKLRKLSKKDKKTYNSVMTKIEKIVSSQNIEHFKNLRKPLQGFKRVHITKRFVLVFKYLKSKDLVKFYELEHRDKVYESLPKN